MTLFLYEIIGFSYDAIQVISQAVNRNQCSSINGSSVSMQDRNAMLECLKKVRLNRGRLEDNRNANTLSESLWLTASEVFK